MGKKKDERKIINIEQGERKYTFRVDERTKRVIGYLKVGKWELVKRVSKCSPDDHWDAVVGIAVAKLRLDLLFKDTEIYGNNDVMKGNISNISWEKQKEFIERRL